jgi:hypothetical protein
MIPRLLTLALLVASTVPVVTDGTPYQPIRPEAYTQDLELAGFANGYMPERRMIGVAGCTIEREAGYTLSLMLEAAWEDGMRSLEPEECYRTFDQQAAVYDKRCPEVEQPIVRFDPEVGADVAVGSQTTRECSGPPTARPGTSNHGWGRAIDFGNGRRTLTCGDPELQWLEENGARFGWVHPDWAQCGRTTEEPWHWEWGGVEETATMPSPVEPGPGDADGPPPAEQNASLARQ